LEFLEKMARTRSAELSVDTFIATDMNGEKLDINFTLGQLNVSEINFKRRRPPKPETSLKNFLDFVSKFTNNIEGLLSNYHRPLAEESQSKKAKILTEEEVQLLFESLDPIGRNLRTFVTELSSKISITIGLPDLSSSLDILISIIPLFELLIESFPHSMRVLTNLFQKKPFAKLITTIDERMGGTLTFKDLILVPLKNIQKFYLSFEDFKYSVDTSEPFYDKLREIDHLFKPIEYQADDLVSPIIRNNIVEDLIESSTNINKKLMGSLMALRGKFYDDSFFEMSFSDESLPNDGYDVFFFSSGIIIFSKIIGDKKKKRKFELVVPLEPGLLEVVVKSNSEFDLIIPGQKDISLRDRALRANHWYDIIKQVQHDEVNLAEFKLNVEVKKKKK